MRRFCLILFCSLLLSGCGYRFDSKSKEVSSRTVTIPYIEGDEKGDFTAALIHEMASSGRWKYVSSNGDLSLKVALVSTRDEEIGYSYSIQNGEVNKWLVSDENKFSALAKVELIETSTQKVLLGPTYLSTAVYYDYDPNFNADNLVRFSLAQYNFQEIAHRSARLPLNEGLSTVIIEFLNNAW